MPTSFPDFKAVGVLVNVTLTDGTVVKGTVFTYNPQEELLVIIQGLSEGNPTIKIIRTNFIKEFKILTDSDTDKLPTQLGVKARLPSMQAGRDKSLFKHASSQLRSARDKRTALLQTDDENTPIGALETLSKLARIFPDIHWDKNEGVIRFNNDVFVKGKPNWSTPVAVACDGCSEDSGSLVDRIQKILLKK